MIVIAFAIFVGLRPGTFSVARSTIVAASPTAVVAQVNDLQLWDAWSPWKDLDPQAKTSLSSPTAGKGASFTWNGNDQIGEGSITIVDTKPDKMVDVEQEFVRPFAGKANMVFTFEPTEGGMEVTWHIMGKNNFAGKLVSSHGYQRHARSRLRSRPGEPEEEPVEESGVAAAPWYRAYGCTATTRNPM